MEMEMEMNAKSLVSKSVVFVVCVAAFLVAGCSSDSGQGSEILDEPPLGLPLPETVTSNADEFEKGFRISVSDSWDVEAYIVDDDVNSTLDYYRNNMGGWREPEYSKDQIKSFTFHRLKFSGDKGEVTIGATELNSKTYLTIIGNSSSTQ